MASFLVLHMDKFGREAVRGIQSHNQRERKSRSNPDIDSEKSNLNYDLHNEDRVGFQKVINNRLDSLNLKRAPRHDAVYMCGVIVSSNLEFFQNLEAAEQKRFFQSAKNWLEDFVGPENVIAANVHLDEKTPHLHFCHVPVTPDGRLCAKDIYTRSCLKRMQSELPKYLQSLGFEIERGVIQESGSATKHLETRDFKQQQAALEKLRQESELESARLESLKQIISGYEKLAAEAEKVLAEKPELPSPGMFKAQAIHEAATSIISLYQQALTDKQLVDKRNKFLERRQSTVDEQIKEAEEKAAEKIAEAEQKATEEIRRQSQTAKNHERELSDKLRQAATAISQRDQTIKHIMADMKGLLSENSRLKELEKEWLSHKQEEKMAEIIRLEKESSQAPKKQSAPSVAQESQPASSVSPSPTFKNRGQGLSR